MPRPVKVIADMSGDNRRQVMLKGGNGGLGNHAFCHFHPCRHRNTRSPDRKLWSCEVRLELKVIADVGLVGFPNVGKSTLISHVTNATPKIANYHFTTLNPNPRRCGSW